MNNLIRRSVNIFKQDGVRGFIKSASAYIYNNIFFSVLINFRARYYRKRGHVGFHNPYQRLWINPNEITHVYCGCFNQKTRLGQIKNGSWDKQRIHITESSTYIGLKQRFHEGYAWEETVYYQRAVDQIESGKTVMGYQSVEGFENRLEYVDRLYQNINENGYLSQQELTDDDWDPHRHPVVTPAHKQVGEVGVNISRKGKIIQNDGIHRLAIAKLEGIDEIPVQVIVRHRQWQEIRDNIVKSNKLENYESGHIKHPDIKVLLD